MRRGDEEELSGAGRSVAVASGLEPLLLAALDLHELHLEDERGTPGDLASSLSFLPPLIFMSSIWKTRAALPGILPPAPRSPYASSDGMYISHLSPSTISCMASVQPLITCFGAKVV